MDLKEHKKLLREKFALQARLYESTVKFRHLENVVPMIELAAPKKADRLLDVATGSGFAAIGFSAFVKSVTGVDLTPEMVELAKRFAHEKGVENALYLEGDAEDLHFGPGSFEIVICRLTFHHFTRPEKALSEMKRVLAPDGRIVLYDFLAGADAKVAKLHNAIELARDPSHIRIYTNKEFQDLFKEAGLEVNGRVVTLLKRDFDHWMAYVGADEKLKKKVRKLMEDSIEGDTSGLFARVRGAALSFSHTCVCWLLTPKS